MTKLIRVPFLRDGRDPLYVYVHEKDLQDDIEFMATDISAKSSACSKNSMVSDIYENREKLCFDDFQLN